MNRKMKGNHGNINKVQGPKSLGTQKLVKKTTGKKTVQTENDTLAPKMSTRATSTQMERNLWFPRRPGVLERLVV
jgi:hypothetical protein